VRSREAGDGVWGRRADSRSFSSAESERLRAALPVCLGARATHDSRARCKQDGEGNGAHNEKEYQQEKVKKTR